MLLVLICVCEVAEIVARTVFGGGSMFDDVEVYWENGQKRIRVPVDGVLAGKQVFDVRGGEPRLVDARSADGMRVLRHFERRRKLASFARAAVATAAALGVYALLNQFVF